MVCSQRHRVAAIPARRASSQRRQSRGRKQGYSGTCCDATCAVPTRSRQLNRRARLACRVRVGATCSNCWEKAFRELERRATSSGKWMAWRAPEAPDVPIKPCICTLTFSLQLTKGVSQQAEQVAGSVRSCEVFVPGRKVSEHLRSRRIYTAATPGLLAVMRTCTPCYKHSWLGALHAGAVCSSDPAADGA